MKTFKIHELKTLPQYFQKTWDGEKLYELRKDDRGYAVGDKLVLQEWDANEYTGREITARITEILRNCSEYGLMDGYCILSIDVECESETVWAGEML